MAWLYWRFTGHLGSAIVAALVMLVLGFLLSAVGGYLVGLVGGSNQPVSGLTLSALILAALLMVAFGVTGLAGVGAVLGVAAVVCCAICVSGSLIQDLKVGRHAGRHPPQDGVGRDHRHHHHLLRAGLPHALAAHRQHQAGRHRHRRPRPVGAPGRADGPAGPGDRGRRDALGADPVRDVFLGGPHPHARAVAHPDRGRHVPALRDHRRHLRGRLPQGHRRPPGPAARPAGRELRQLRLAGRLRADRRRIADRRAVRRAGAPLRRLHLADPDPLRRRPVRLGGRPGRGLDLAAGPGRHRLAAGGPAPAAGPARRPRRPSPPREQGGNHP